MTINELLDRENIKQTMAQYTIAGDFLSAERFSATFTEDGILALGGIAERGVHDLKGREAIYLWFAKWCAQRRNQSANQPGMLFVRHHISSCKIDFVDTNTAKVRSYWMSCSENGVEHCGHYIDTFRRCTEHQNKENRYTEQWLIAQRILKADQ